MSKASEKFGEIGHIGMSRKEKRIFLARENAIGGERAAKIMGFLLGAIFLGFFWADGLGAFLGPTSLAINIGEFGV